MEKYIHNLKRHKRFSFSFVLVGILSLVWLVYRTGTKPSRAGYPCQKAAAASSTIFLFWLASILGGHFLFVRLKKHFTWARLLVVVFMVSLFGLGIKEYQVLKISQVRAQLAGSPPIGTPKGTNPGRVVWVHDSNATTGTYTNYWTQVDQTTVDTMLDTAIKTLANQPNVGAALTRIFPCGASCTGRKVAIKVNMNNVFMGNASSMDANYQTVKAFLKEITTTVPGVFAPFNQTDIYVYDTSREISGGNRTYFANAIKADFPNVHVVGLVGSNGAERAVFSSEAFIYDANYCTPTQAQNLRVPQLIKDADYLVNMPLLKGHGMSGGSTLGFKNLVGNVESVTAYTSPWETAGLHNCLVIANNPTGLVAVYTAGFTNPDSSPSSIDRKMVLTIGDGLYGDQFSNTNPPRNWRMFGNKAPNSLFVSQDPVAVDSVMFDTIMQETRNYQAIGQQHLEAAAQRSAGSLGVHEHPNMTGKCSSADNLNCWQFRGTAASGIDFVNCDAQGTPDSRCVLGASAVATTSLTLQASQASYTTSDQIPVQVLVRSDIDAANVFSAQLNFPTQNLEVVRINTAGSFVNLWADVFFDNTTGKVSLIGSVPTPGYKTDLAQNPALMATVIFRPKVIGSGIALNFDPSSQILRDSDNTNILSATNSTSLTIADVSSPAPTPSATPTTTPCTITQASWGATSIVQGSPAGLNVQATGDCNSKQVSFEVRRNIILQADQPTNNPPLSNPVTLTQNGSIFTATSNWRGEWVNSCLIGTCDPQYFFKVNVVGDTATYESNPRFATVTKSQTIPTDPNDWPQVQKDAQRTGYSNETLGTNLKVAWTYPFMANKEKVFPQVQAIVYQGKVFVGTEMGSMYALDAVNSEAGTNPPRGRVLWKYTTSNSITGKPASIVSSVVADNGKIYFGAIDGAVYALNADTTNPNGELVWKKQVSPRLGFTASPVLADNKLMVGGQDGNFYALDPDTGNILWQYSVGSPILQTAAYNNGRVFFGAMDMYVYALSTSDGTLSWKSNKIKGLGFKDYWPVVYPVNQAKGINRGLVMIRPVASGIDWSLSPRSYTTADQASLLNSYDSNPSNYNKSLILLYEDDGQEAPAVIHWDLLTMNGAPTSPCIDRDGNIIVSGRRPVSSPTPGLSWHGGWVKVDPATRMVVEPFYDGSTTGQYGNGYSNVDETVNVSCARNLVLAFHFTENSAQSAGYQGAFNLDTKQWVTIPYGWRYGQIMTPGPGNNPASISNGMIYHVIFNELIVRTTN